MKKALAWIVTVFAVISGAGLAATNPGMVQLLVVLGALTVAVIDAADGTPNQYTILVCLALPSMVVGMNGKVASTIDGWLGALWGWASGWLGAWAGTTSLATTALVVAAFAVFTAQRIMPRNGSGVRH